MSAKTLFYFFLLLLCNIYSFAQDTIFFYKKQIKVVQIKSFSDSDISYSPIYADSLITISNEDVDKIILKSGKVIRYELSEMEIKAREKDSIAQIKLKEDSLSAQRLNSVRFNISFNPLEFIFLNSSLYGDIHLIHKRLSLTVPFVYGIAGYERVKDAGFFSNSIKNFTSGVGFKYYFNSKKNGISFLMPMAEFGKVWLLKDWGYSYYNIHNRPLQIYSISIGNSWYFAHHFHLNLFAGLGLRVQSTGYVLDTSIFFNEFLPSFKLGLSFGVWY